MWIADDEPDLIPPQFANSGSDQKAECHRCSPLSPPSSHLKSKSLAARVRSRFLPEETGETFRLRDNKGEFFAERVSGDSGELPQGLVDVLRANAQSFVGVFFKRESPRVDWNEKLAVVGLADDAVPSDARAEEHRGADRPMVLTISFVVVWRATHLALHDDDQLVADAQFLGAAQGMIDAGEQLGDEVHLVTIVIGVAVELANGEIGGNTHTGLEGGEGDLRLPGEPFFRYVFRDEWCDALQGLSADLGGVEHALRALDARQAGLRDPRVGLAFESRLDAVADEIFVVRAADVALDAFSVGDFPEGRQIRNACHRDDVSGGGVVAKGEEGERTFRTAAGGDEGGEGWVSEAIKLPGRHVARAGRMVVDRVIESVEDEQLAGVFLKEGLVAHALLRLVEVRGVRSKVDLALCENVTLFVESIGLIDPFRVHQVGRVPTSRSIEDGVVGTIVRLGFSGRGAGQSRKADWRGDAESSQATEFQEVSSHGFAWLFVEEIVLAEEEGDDGTPRPERVVRILDGDLPRDPTGIDFDR